MKRASVPLLLLLIAAFAFCVRSLGLADVFVGNGDVVLAGADSMFHARRALFSFVNFPAVLFFDSYLAFPAGAVIPAPPLHDWLLAATARALGAGVPGFERVAAWSAPVIAALTVLPVYCAGRVVAGRGVGLAAAAIFAALPASIRFSSVGDADHHAAVAFWIASFAALSADLLRPEIRRRRLRLDAAALSLVRAAVTLTWSGSLLVLALGEGGLLAGAALSGRRALYRAQAAGALAAAALVAPWVVAQGEPIGGAFSATTLSWLQVAALVGVAATAAALDAIEGRRPAAGPGARALRTAALALLIVAGMLAAFGSNAALAPAAAFLTKADTWGSRNLETVPLFGWLGAPAWSRGAPGLRLYGGFAYLIPLAPVALLARLRDPRARASAAGMLGFALGLAPLALLQVRFGSDFAPVGSVGFALLLSGVRAGLARRLPARLASAMAATLCVALLVPSAASAWVHEAASARDFLAGRRPAENPFLTSGPRSLVLFARSVRRATPETSGYFDTSKKPEYGVLAHPNHGHVLQYEARRPTPASNFGPYLDPALYEATRRFYAAESEAEAVAIAKKLSARYVVSFDHFQLEPRLFTYRLQRLDGSARDGVPHVEHFRLIVEGPRNGRPLRGSFPFGVPARPLIPYKLFELVPGALLEVPAAPGEAVDARLTLKTPIGRRFEFRATGRADADGVARVRVPYATRTAAPTRPTGPYRIRTGGREMRAEVDDADVLRGGVVRVAAP